MAKKSVQSNIETSGSKPYRTFFFPLADGRLSRSGIALGYNPESYSVDIQPNWNQRGVAGASVDSSQWEGNQSRQIAFDHLVANKDPEKVEMVLETLESLASEPLTETQRPSLMYLILGYEHRFFGHIDNLSISRLQTDIKGRAVQAEISVTFITHPERQIDRQHWTYDRLADRAGV